MTEAADRVFTNAEVHTLADPDRTDEAVAVRDGRVVRVDSDYEVGFLEGVGTDVVDCEGGVLLPGFVDAHTHVEILGRRIVHADLGDAADRREAIQSLAASSDDGWILGYGYDESAWPDDRLPTREDLDEVSTERPVVAFREDLHTASVNSVVLERYAGALPDSGVRRAGGKPTGVLTEAAAEFLRTETAPDREETRRLLVAARDHAHARGVTGVHDMVRHSDAPAVYRRLAVEDELDLRVRLYYWTDHLDAVEEVGLATDHGSDWVRVGGVKTYTDGSIGARTAKLSEPYADAEAAGSADRETDGAIDDGVEGVGGDETDVATGEWIVDPSELRELVERVDDLGLQLAVHAIGDEAVDETLAALSDDANVRHRIEHAELLPTDLSGVEAVASMQPNFLRWARDDGLYERRLGAERTAASNRFSDVLEAGIPLAFGSDCMPLDPLYGVQQAVTAPEPSQRLSVTQALRAYTSGAAHAGHDEDDYGTVEPGKAADFVVLDASPWEVPDEEIGDVDVRATVVDGEVVFSR